MNFGWVNKIKWFQVLLCITNNSIKNQSFVYAQLNNRTVLFQTIQFSISHFFTLSLNVKQDSDRCYNSEPEWTWEWWQWKSTPLSPKLQHFWSQAIRLFNDVSSTPVGVGVLLLCRDAIGVFYSSSRLGWLLDGKEQNYFSYYYFSVWQL